MKVKGKSQYSEPGEDWNGKEGREENRKKKERSYVKERMKGGECERKE